MKTNPFGVSEHQELMADAAVALSRVLGDRVYAGTVPVKVKARRRAANRVARKSRQINRRAA